MGPAKVEEYRKLILRRLDELAQEDETAKGNRNTVTLDQQSVGRLSRMDALQQQAMANATHQRRTKERMALNSALERIEDGSYGECQDCGDDIDERRLSLSPAIMLCISCARG